MLYVIAGDIGGTKTLLQFVEIDHATQHYGVLYEQRYASQDYGQFDLILANFLTSISHHPRFSRTLPACFAVAGPITSDADTGQSARVTNLPWLLHNRDLQDKFALRSVCLINDFAAIAHGLVTLRAADSVSLQTGLPQANGPKIILGAGTGLGVCQIIYHSHGYQVLASEGGHCDFAPGDALQIELLRYLLKIYPHLSYDRILSGLGIRHIFEFLYHYHNQPHDIFFAQVSQADDAAAFIANAYYQQPLAREAIDTFVSIYGAQAGNLALTNLAYGGVYIAGGIAPKLIQQMQDTQFLSAFRSKGRMSPLMVGFPVYVIMNTQAGVRGAAVVAATSVSP